MGFYATKNKCLAISQYRLCLMYRYCLIRPCLYCARQWSIKKRKHLWLIFIEIQQDFCFLIRIDITESRPAVSCIVCANNVNERAIRCYWVYFTFNLSGFRIFNKSIWSLSLQNKKSSNSFYLNSYKWYKT